MNPVKCKNCRVPLMRVIYSMYRKSISLCKSSTSTSSSPSQSELSREIQRRFENLKFIEKKKQYEDREILSQIQSIAAQKYLKNDKERFSKLEEKNKILKKINAPRNINSKRIILPLKADENSGIHIQANSESIDKNLDGKSNAEVDRGFFVHGDEYSEDYSAATTAEMPADEMTEPPIRYYGNLTEAVEDIEFQLPGQISKPTEKNVKLTENSPTYIGDWASNYGTVEASEEELVEFKELKDAKCASCGAQFHCYNRSLPGFVPLELLKEIERNSKKDPFYQRNDFNCRRCYLLKEYNFLLNLNVCNVDYAKMMSHLKLIQEVLILLIVDMTDLQGSIIHELPKIIGSHKPLIVIGNKLDLLPPDTKPGYLRHYRDSLRKAIADAGISKNFNVLKYLLISAKTGFGVEDLITNVYKNWIGPRGVLRNDIYVIGATNAGKSTLFNTFIQSDLCKVRAMDLVERVTTSIWPGTTMSLLKFPLMNPSPQKLELRRRRLISMQAWAKKEEQISRLFSKTGNPKYLVLHGLVESTFKEREENLQPISTSKIIKQFNGELTPTEELEELKEEKKNKMGLNDRAFQKGHWCFDTPGTVNNKQVLDLFTLEELVNIVPRSTLTPRIFIVFPGQSLLLGTIACIDILQSSTAIKEMVPIYVTVFASQKLKVNVMASKYADEFMQKNQGDVSLGAPIGNAERLAKFPELDGIDFEIDGESKLENGGIADIVLSSIGWAMVTTEANFVRARASTPAGRGLLLRKPPLIPFAADYREKRIKGTAEYTIRPFHEYDARQRKGDFGKRNNKNGDLPRDIVNFDLA